MVSLSFYTYLLFLYIFLLSFGICRQQSTPSISNHNCNVDVLNFTGHCVVYNEKPMTWASAEQHCIKLGGHLISIHSAGYNTVIGINRPNTTNTPTGEFIKDYYIGCNDSNNEGFIWSDGTLFDYDVLVENNENENCCEMIDTGSWNDISCNAIKKSICKISENKTISKEVSSSVFPNVTTQITASTKLIADIPVKIANAKNAITAFLNMSSSGRKERIAEKSVQKLLESANTIITLTTFSIENNPDWVIIIMLINILLENSKLIFGNRSVDQFYRFQSESIFFQIEQYILDDKTNKSISFPLRSINVNNLESIAIPPMIFSRNEKNVSKILVSTSILKVNSVNNTIEDKNKVATNIISIFIPEIHVGESLSAPVRLTFPTSRNISNPLCSFLDFTRDPPTWNQFGIRLVKKSANRVICESIHLTNFAVLAGSMTQPSNNIERLALSLTSYILLVLSLLFMIASIIAYLICYKTVFKTEINILYFNFAISLSIAIFTFLLSSILARTTKIDIICSIMAFLIHYTWINVFTSGTACTISLLYAILITLLRGERKKIYPYIIVASWVFPLLVVVPTSVIGIFHYGSYYQSKSDICIISYKNNLIISFYSPIIMIICLNIIMLVIVSILLFKAFKIQDKNIKDLLLFKKLIISTLILLPILGLPFLLVPIIAHANITISAVDWVFIFLYCPIGIIFFVLVTLRNNEILRKISQWGSTANIEYLDVASAQKGEEMKAYELEQ